MPKSKSKKPTAKSKKPKANHKTPATAASSAYALLDLGCGLHKRAGAVGIDINPRSQADVIHDLNVFPYPFLENHFDEIICDNVVEHLDDIVKVMGEVYRIAKPSGIVTMIVPFFSHRHANTDPTHRHFFGLHSFDYFVEGTANAGFRYSEAKFELLSVEFEKGLEQGHWFDRLISSFANARKELYENRLANIFPLRNLTFVLRVKK